MKVQYKAELLARCPVSFVSQEGEQVEYEEFYFLNTDENGDNSVVKLNSKLETPVAKGTTCLITVEVDPDNKRKTKLVAVKAVDSE